MYALYRCPENLLKSNWFNRPQDETSNKNLVSKYSPPLP